VFSAKMRAGRRWAAAEAPSLGCKQKKTKRNIMNNELSSFGVLNDGNKRVSPDLLLVFYDNKPLNEVFFLNSLIKNLKIPASNNTKIYCYQSEYANDIQNLLVEATVIALKRSKERSQEPDMDETIYQNYRSFSPQEPKISCGYIFQIFVKNKNTSVQPTNIHNIELASHNKVIICPDCNMENEEHALRCRKCGSLFL
jgi:ribosomal protein L40E